MNIPGKIKDEEKLLLGLCRLEFNGEQKALLAVLSEKINNWEYFANLATMHGVSALAFDNLEKNGLIKFVPTETAGRLKAAMLKSIGRNVFLTEAITEVLRLLNENDIKTVLLKGMALEKSIYGNRGLRQMNDVDILIQREQCLKARNILIHNGFVSLPVKSVFHRIILDHIGKHLPSLLKNGASIEIHHGLFTESLHSLTTRLYNESKEISVNGEKAFLPQPMLFFLYLVRHLEKHELNNESQLRLYTDLVTMIEKHSDEIINYNLLALASHSDMDQIIAGHLHALREFWSMQFPGWLDEFIEKWNPSGTTERFMFFLRSPKNELTEKKGAYRQVIKEITGIHRKIIFVLGDMFPTFSFMQKRYKCSRRWEVILYYPHRLGKLWWLLGK